MLLRHDTSIQPAQPATHLLGHSSRSKLLLSLFTLQAVEANRVDVVERLAQSRAQLKARDGNGNTALHLAMRCKVWLLAIDVACEINN